MTYPFQKLIDGLTDHYKDDVPALTRLTNKERNPFLVLIGCLLSLRTKDEVTDVAMERLMKRMHTPEELLALSEEEIQKLIYPVGFYRNKARLLREISYTIITTLDGRVPDTIEGLLKLKGVGRKTANIVITEGFGKDGIAVDTHVHRISNRIGAVKTKAPDETEMALRKILPRNLWITFNALLVTHGRRTCAPISPFCSRCPVNDLCMKIGVGKSR